MPNYDSIFLLQENNHIKKAPNIVMLRAFFLKVYAVKAVHYSTTCLFAYQYKYQQQHRQVRAPCSWFLRQLRI